jgi:hypothetical protein
VHSIQELAALARARLGQQPGSTGGRAAGPQPGSGSQPGWAAEPQAGPLPGPGGRPASLPPLTRSGGDSSIGGDSGSLTDDLAGAAFNAAAGAAARFIGRAISRRVQDRLNQQVLPAMAARQESMLRTQVEIADRHPDLCACLNDQVVFLTGGSRTQPMPNLMTVTVEQADALVAQLRSG